jgi:hypothetical protein
MNRMRSTMLAGVLAVVGGLGLGVVPAQAQVRGAAPVPGSYYYGPGYNGYGYYFYPTAPAFPTYRGGFYSTPAPTSRVPVTRSAAPTHRFHDPAGRDLPLYKPWLRPLQD